MPYYQVLIEGSGLELELQGSERSVAGFFATRVVFAATESTARDAALGRILNDWRSGPYAAQRGSAGLRLAASDCARIGFLRGLLRKPSGYTFFQAEA